MILLRTVELQECLLGQLERDLPGVPIEAIRDSVEPEKRGGRGRLPKTRDPLLVETWALLEWMIRKAHHEILCHLNVFIRLFRLDEVFGSFETARRQVYRLLALNGHRVPRARKTRLDHDPAHGRLPSNCVRRQRKKLEEEY